MRAGLSPARRTGGAPRTSCASPPDPQGRLQEALARLADGDRSAFHPVFTLAWPMVRSFTRALLRGAPDADDAAQEALLRVFERSPAFDPARPAVPWIMAIAFNECRTLRRRRFRRREDAIDAADGLAGHGSMEDELVRADLVRAARAALDGLPEADVDTLMAALDGDRPEGVPAATFRKRLERARARLRRAWRERHGHS